MVRDINRILDIVILDMDIENSTITFSHSSKAALEIAKRELNCIGFPVLSLQIHDFKNGGDLVTRTVA